MKTGFALTAFLFIIFSFSVYRSIAGIVSRDEAVTVAMNFIETHGNAQGLTIKQARDIKSRDILLAYVIDLDARGFVVVPSSTGSEPVIAYSFENDFGEIDSSNPLLDLIIADLNNRLKFNTDPGNSSSMKNENRWNELLGKESAVQSDPLFEQWPATGDGWLKTNWTQSAPYNDFCPMDPIAQQRSFAGCPATAMAQIMNFHETVNNTRFDDNDDYYHNYAGAQYFIDDDAEFLEFPSFPQLNEYLDTLEAHYLSHVFLTDEDKAALTFACAVAEKEVFSAQGSGTFGVGQAYNAYLRFGCSTVDLLDTTDSDLYDRLKQNIKDTLPAHLAIVDPSWSTGHNVVVDGYNTNDYYHLNFGWGGPYNGWYLIPQEIPYGLTVIEGLVLDIMQTSTGIESTDDRVFGSSVVPNPVKDLTCLNYSLTVKGAVKFDLYNLSGQLVKTCQLKDQKPGNQVITLNLGNLPSGIYFYTLQTGDGTSSGKIARIE